MQHILIVLKLSTFQRKLKNSLETKASQIFIEYELYNLYDYSVMHGYFHIGVIDIMLNNKMFRDGTNLFSPNSFKKNDKIILRHFQ